MKKFIATLAALVMSLTLVACSQPASADIIRSDKPYNSAPQVSAADLAMLVEGNSEFALRLYEELKAEDGNLFYSPYSISLMLAMTYAGARTQTQSQMEQALNFNLGPEELHQAFNYLAVQLANRVTSDAAFKLEVVNDLWGQKDFAFLDGFLDLLAENYDAGLRVLDFENDPEGARQVINDYIYDQTNKLIEDLIPEGSINTWTRLVLTNAIYFKADWKHKFNKLDTRDGTFYLLDGSQVTASMMNQRRVFSFAAGSGWQAIELPYVGDQIVMDIIMPDTGTFASFEDALSAQMLDQIIAAMSGTDIQLTLPKFKFGSEFALKAALSNLGMPIAFDPSAADFSGITDAADLFIQDAVHKAFVSVDEDGTEAAAAGAVIMGTTSMPQSMRVDHPFFFLIRDIGTGTILFFGRVVNPVV
jgi:serpin B